MFFHTVNAFQCCRVRSSKFVRLTEWAVGVRLRVVVDGDEICTAYPETDQPGTELPTVCIHLPDDENTTNSEHGVSTHSLEAYILALNSHFQNARGIATTGSPYTDTTDTYSKDIQNGAETLRKSNNLHEAALKWAANLNLTFISGHINDPSSLPQISSVDPAYVATAFSLMPGPLYESSMNEFLQV